MKKNDQNFDEEVVETNPDGSPIIIWIHEGYGEDGGESSIGSPICK